MNVKNQKSHNQHKRGFHTISILCIYQIVVWNVASFSEIHSHTQHTLINMYVESVFEIKSYIDFNLHYILQ